MEMGGSNMRTPVPRSNSSGPDQGKLNQQLAQGGGLQSARDKMESQDRRKRALRAVGRSMALKKVREDGGIGRVTAAQLRAR